MICRNCREAGDYNQQGLASTAAVCHSKCMGPGCTCQHGTGDMWTAHGATRS